MRYAGPNLDRGRLPAIRGTTTGTNCSKCPFAKDGRPYKPVVGEGPADPHWLIVGEGPAMTEQIMGRPFVGASGQIVNKMLTAIHCDRNRLWVDNVTCCKPPPDAEDSDKNRARKACEPRFSAQIRRFPGRPVLALGAHAARAFLGAGLSITELAGSYHEIDKKRLGGKRVVIPTIHPAAILRGGAGVGGAHAPDIAFWNLIYDATKIQAIADGKDILFREEDIYTECHDWKRTDYLIEMMLAEIYREGMCAVDTETYVDNEKQHSALQPINAKMSAIGLATTNWGISVAWHTVTGRSQRALAQMFADPKIVKVMHNRIYDRGVLKRHGMPIVGPNDCTLLLHHNAFPGLAHKLQRVGTQYFAISPWKSEFRAGKDTPENLTRYCAKDTLVTARLKAPLEIAIKKTRSEKTYEIDLACSEVAEWMYDVGVPINREANQELYETFSATMVESRRAIEDAANDPAIRETLWERLAFEQALRIRRPAKQPKKWDPDDFGERVKVRLNEIKERFEKGKWEWKIGSSDYVAAYLRARGVPLHMKTPTGKTSTQKEILNQYTHLPEVSGLLDYRKAQKLFSTFVYKMLDRYKDDEIVVYGYADANDRIHPRWSVHKISGRWGAEDPSVMNWSKGERNPVDNTVKVPNLRTQVIAPKGRILVGFDMEQLEARGHALMTADPWLVAVFHGNKDIHSELARVVWPEYDGLPYALRKQLRDTIKRPEYCLVPGTRILKTDLTWQPIEALKPGDKLIGFTAAAPGKPWKENYFRTSTVRSVKHFRQPCYRIVTTRGELIASDEHLWVGHLLSNAVRRRELKLKRKPRTRHQYYNKQWIRTDELRPGDRLAFTHEPWLEDRSWTAGYLAGIYDGEGWVRPKCVGFGQRVGDTQRLVERFLRERGFSIRAHVEPDDMWRSDFTGIWECLAFLGIIRPRRLLAQSSRNWRGRRLRSKRFGAEVVAVEYVGIQDVVAVATTSRTFIAEGFLSHNCSFYGGDPTTAWKSVVKDYPDVKLQDVVKMVQMMQQRMPNIARWHQELLRDVARPPHEIRSAIYGRRRCFPLGNADRNEVWNHPIQSLGADIMAFGLLRFLPRLKAYGNAWPILQIHDAMVFECDEDDAEKLKRDCIECFTQEHTYRGTTVNFPIDAKIGKSWAEL